MKKGWALMILITIFGLSSIGCGGTPTEEPCNVEAVAKADEDLQSILQEWSAALPDQSAAISESLPTDELQAIRNKAADYKVPLCMQAVKDHLLKYMDQILKAFVGFKSGELSIREAQTEMIDAVETLTLYTKSRAAVNACAPNCE